MALVVAPIPAAPFSAQTTATAVSLAPGQTVVARLVGIEQQASGSVLLRLVAGGQQFEMATDAASATTLAFGTTVAVTRDADGTVFMRPLPQPEGATGGAALNNDLAAGQLGAGSARVQSAAGPLPSTSEAVNPQAGDTATTRGVATQPMSLYDGAHLAATPSGDPVVDALVALQRQAVEKQGSLSQLFSTLTRITSPGADQSELSADLVDTLRDVLSFTLDEKTLGQPAGGGAALRQAILRSGLFFENSLATTGDKGTLPADLKGALAVLHGKTGAEQSPPSATIGTLHSESEGGLARITLAQTAALRAMPRSESEAGAGTATLHFELPVLVAGQPAALAMSIHHEEAEEAEDKKDGKRGAAGGGWTMRFRLDAEPLGPVEAAVSVQGTDVSIALEAGRAATLDLFGTERPGLEDALSAAGLHLDRLDILALPAKTETGPDDSVPAVINRVDRTA